MKHEFIYVFLFNLLVPDCFLYEFSGEGEVENEPVVSKYQCHCQDDKCNPRGECLAGYICDNGWFGPGCQYECAYGFPGQDCFHNCSQFCAATNSPDLPTCHHVTGMCLNGCQQGYEGLTCSNFKEEDVAKTTQASWNWGNIGLLIGLSCVILVVVIAFGCLVLYWRLHFRVKSTAKSTVKSTVKLSTALENGELVYVINSVNQSTSQEKI